MIAKARARARSNGDASVPAVRVAAYTRQSVSKDGDPEFGSIEAQREAVAAYVTVRKADGWVLLPADYSDQGVSGKSIRRPAFQRLLEDVEAGRVDCIATYKIDRLSRSLPDFTRLMAHFEKHGVTFVSTTQSIDTSTSSGKLMLNVLASFAEYEREAVSERVYDKLMASRRRGLWTGGNPPIGYDVVDRALVVNDAEAAQVRETFAAYLSLGSLRETAEALNRRGWTTKSWTTKSGVQRIGTAWSKNSLRNLLTSPVPAGKLHADGELHDGLHEAIVDGQTWDAVQAQLAARSPSRGPTRPRTKTGALLQGLVRCGQCQSAMGPHSTKRHGRRYVSYVCQTVQRQGARACPGSRVPAHEMDGFVVSQLRALGSDPDLQRATIEAAKGARTARLADLRAQIKEGRADARRLEAERTALQDRHGPDVARRVAEIDDAHQRATEATQAAQGEAQALSAATLRKADLRAALEAFVPVWEHLFPAERRRVISLLIERVVYDAAAGELTIDYRPGGIRALAQEAEA
jgi:site-specific DNA recombinase